MIKKEEFTTVADWENDYDWIEALEEKLEVEEDFYEQEYYSKIPCPRKTDNAGWWNDFRFSRMYTRRYESKPTIAKHRALRKAKKETRSFNHCRDIETTMCPTIMYLIWSGDQKSVDEFWNAYNRVFNTHI